MLASLIFLANMIVIGIPTALLFIPWCWMTGDVMPLYRGTRFILSSGCRLAGVRFRVEGLEHIPRNRACIFMANHVSNLDPPALISLIPGRTSAFLKKSLMKIPVLGIGFKQGEFISVDRTGSASAAKEIKALIGDTVDKVQAGSALVSESGQVLSGIVDSVKRVTDIVAEIAAASQEQSSGIDQVNRAVSQMDQTTQQNAALVEEAAAASKSIVARVNALDELVSRYNLGEQEEAAAMDSVRRSLAA